MTLQGEKTMNRRDFLSGVALTATVGCATKAHPVVASAMAADTASSTVPADWDWSWLRGQFLLSRDWIHLSTFLFASHPKVVRDAIDRHRRALDDNPSLYLTEHDDESPVLAAAAAYLGVSTTEIALTDSTTMGLGTLYNGFSLRPTDEILTTVHDHYATHEALRLTASRAGATVRKVVMYERPADATGPAMADAIAKGITPNTRIVAVTWVHSSTGVKTPVREIAAVVAAANVGRTPEDRVYLCVDGVHGFGIEDVQMADLGCDFFVAGCHKWLFGPRGTGLIWGKTDAWPVLRPTIPHFGAEAWDAWVAGVAPPPTNAEMMTPGGYHSFEHRWGLTEAFDFHRQLGKAKIAARTHELNRQAKEGLAAMGHVTLLTPMADELSAGIVTFEVAGLEPKEVVTRLRDQRILGRVSPYVPSHPRIAPGVLNTPEDVDLALAAIHGLA